MAKAEARGRLSEAVARARPFLPEAALITICTTAFTCVFFRAVVVHLGSTIVGFPEGSDSTGTIAAFWETRHEGGYQVVGTLHHTYTGAPYGWSQSAVLNTQVLLVNYPAYLLAHVIGPVAAYNLVTLAGYVLSGLAMYVLVRYLGCNPLVSAWAALAFIVFPFHLVHQEHASLIHLEALALLIVALVAVARRPSWSRFALLGVANLACWLTSGYFGPMAAITTIAFAIGAALTMKPRRGVAILIGSAAAVLAAGAVIGVDAVASGTNTGAGLDRGSGNLSIYGLRPSQLVVPPNQNILVGKHLTSFWASRAHGSDATEIVSYLGLLTIALAASWLWIAWRRHRILGGELRAATVGLVAAFVAGLAFSAPSPIILFGHTILWTPARLLWHIVPPFRIQARWDFLLMAALLPLAALGLQMVWRRLAARRVTVAVAAVGIAMVWSFCELAIRPAEPRFRTVPTPPEYAAVRQTPPGILVHYPLGYSNNYLLWQHVHGRPVLNGAPVDTPGDYARLMLLDPVQPGTAQALSFLGVTAIGIHPRSLVGAEVDPGDPAHTAGYELVGRFSNRASIWTVTARPAPAFITLPDGFGAPRRERNGLVGFPLVASTATLDIAARTPSTVRVVFDALSPENRKSVLRIGDMAGERMFTLRGRTRVSFLVAVPRGRSRLLVKTDAKPTSAADAVILSAPRTQLSLGIATLRAQLLSANPGL